MRRGGERVARDQLTPLIRSEGEGGEANTQIKSCFQLHPYIDLSFSYLCSAVEASLDIKKVQMEPNRVYPVPLNRNVQAARAA